MSALESPEDVLRAVAADAEVQALAPAIIFFPNRLAAAFPTLRDGIADERDVARAGIVPGALQYIVRALARVQRRNYRGVRWNDGGDGGRRRSDGRRRAELSGKSEDGDNDHDGLAKCFHKFV